MLIYIRHLSLQYVLTDRHVYSWMDDLRFYVLFNCITVILGQWAGDNERLCTMETRLQFKRAGIEPRTARSEAQCSTHLAIGVPGMYIKWCISCNHRVSCAKTYPVYYYTIC